MSEENKNLLPQASQRVVDKIREEGAGYYNPVVWQGMTNLAKVLLDAKVTPSGLDTQAKILVALQSGRELGLSPIKALNSFYIVKGKVQIYGDSAIAVVLRDGHDVEWGECNAKTATVKITRGDNKKSLEATFTYDEAERKGLTKYADGRKNEFWQKYPENMLKFKAFGSIARFIVADSLNGMSIKEEVDGSSIDGELVEETTAPRITTPDTAQAKTVEPVATVEAEEADESASLNEFVNKEEAKPAEPEKKRTKAEIVKDINKLCLDNGKDPKKILEHYKKKSWFDFKLENLINVEESVKLSIKPAVQAVEATVVAPSKNEPVEDESLVTYYMPEEDVLEIVNELMAHEGATDLSEAQQNLLNDVSEDKFLGKDNARYKGIF